MDKFEELENKYEQKREERIKQIRESQGMDNSYEITANGKTYELNLPKRVLEQKRLAHLGAKWMNTRAFVAPVGVPESEITKLYQDWEKNVQNDPVIEEQYLNAITPLIYINGQKVIIDELEIGEIDALMQLYWDFMLYPFSLRAITTANTILQNA